MNFEVNGESYFLAVMAGSGRPALFAPARGGMRQLDISSDAGPFAVFPAGFELEGNEGSAGLN